MQTLMLRNQPIEFDRLITPDDQVYKFNNQVDQFVISGISGLGMPPITYRVQKGPFQHGVTPLGFVLDPRVISFIHRRNGNCRDDYWNNRADLLDFLRPNRQPLGVFQTFVLRKILPNGNKRDLNVLIQQGPTFTGKVPGRWDEFSFSEALQFVAHDPVFFDPELFSVTMSLPTTLADDIVFSFDFTFIFLGSGEGATDTITYNGTWQSFPTIIMHGPLTNPVVANLTTQEKIQLETTIAAGRTVTINLEFGNKTVFDDLGNNLIGDLSTDSDLATFHLAPTPEAPLGVNTMSVAASGMVNGQSQIFLQYFERYIGI